MVEFREVVPNQTFLEEWKDILINTGGTHSTLQDIKLPDGAKAGGYAIKDKSGKDHTQGRFIIWRVSHDVLELSEHSLNVTLHGGRIRYKFQGLPILEGITVHETNSHVIVLVATVSSVHRLLFPHPSKLHKQEPATLANQVTTFPSILADASTSTAKDPSHFHVINYSSTTAPLPHTSYSCLSKTEAIFALASTTSILVVKLGATAGNVSTFELQSTSFVPRRLTGFIPGVLKGSSDNGEATQSLVMHPINGDIYIFALGRDGRLRVWSYVSQKCLQVLDILDKTYDPQRKFTPGNQRHMLRKSVSTEGHLHFLAYLCFSKQRFFVVVRPDWDSGFRLHPVATIQTSDDHLIDFGLSNDLLHALWTTEQGETVLQYKSLKENAQWKNVFMDPPVEAELVWPERVPGAKMYLDHIFYPGRFALQTIAKALMAFRRPGDSTLMIDGMSNLEAARECVAKTVEAEIDEQASECDVSDEELAEITHQSWSRLYTCCVQYHQKRTLPLGLLINPSTKMVCVLKRGMLSFVRPTDILDSLLLNQGAWDADLPLTDDPVLNAGLLTVVRVLSTINMHLSSDLELDFESQLEALKNPDEIARQIALKLVEQSDEVDVLQDVRADLQHTEDLSTVLAALQEMMSLDMNSAMAKLAQQESDDKSGFLCRGQLGVGVITETVRQVIETRFAFSRAILLLEALIVMQGTRLGVSKLVQEKIRSEFIPRTVPFTQAFYAMLWVTRTYASPVASTALEQSLQQMAVLRLQETSQPTPPSFSAIQTLLELYVSGNGRTKAQKLSEVACDLNTIELFNYVPSVSLILAQLMWPLSQNFHFPAFLLSSCQYTGIRGYVRLLDSWCSWNICSRQFILGVALLNTGKPEEACESFVRAAEGAYKEDYLANQLLQSTGNEGAAHLTLKYYMRVVQLFEQAHLPVYVIRLAEAAIRFAEPGDPLLASFWSILSKNHLQLGHHDEAYEAIVSNPDTSRKPDSLRLFLATLLEKRCLQDLVRYPYIGLEEEMQRFVEMRARSCDLLASGQYYAFLYAFHVHKGNMRKAAAVMYEQSLRLSQERGHIKALQKQVQCLLACLQALKLINADNAWVVRPRTDSSVDNDTNGVDVPKTVEVLEYDEVEKEYELAYARLRLARLAPEALVTDAAFGPSDVVTLLIRANLFEAAARLAQRFQTNRAPIVEGLTNRCLHLSAQQSVQHLEADHEAWNWLAENIQGIVAKEGKASDAAWDLLQKLVNALEEPGQTICHKVVARRILNADVSLPYWLEASYKLRNPGQLIGLYHEAGCLEDAVRIALELIDALLGKGKERFGFSHALHVNAPPKCLPVTAIDRILLELHHVSADPFYSKILQALLSKVEVYKDTARKITARILEERS